MNLLDQPVWNRIDLFEKLANSSQLTKQYEGLGFSPETGDPPTINQHIFRMGPCNRLGNSGGIVASTVKRICGFTSGTRWYQQEKSIPIAFQRFFSRDAVFGWYSILTARKAATLRHTQDSLTLIIENDSRFATLAPVTTETGEASSLSLDTAFPLQANLFSPPAILSSSAACDWTRISVPRRIRCEVYQIDCNYTEERICLSNPDCESHLRRGTPPGFFESSSGHSGIRTSILIDMARLVRLEECFGSVRWRYETEILEIHPESGQIVSIRRSRMPFGAAVMCWSPTGRRGLHECLHNIR